jgi:hypothetical protein
MSMNDNIVVQIKQVYGNDTIYPVCERAKLFTELLGQKSLTFTDMRIIQAMGFKVTIQQPTIPAL